MIESFLVHFWEMAKSSLWLKAGP